jgi:hypothetical protein
MKKKILISAIFSFFFLFSINTFSQDVPNPPGQHGQTGDQPAGNAPIGSGLLILLGLGAAYGGRKLYEMKAEETED